MTKDISYCFLKEKVVLDNERKNRRDNSPFYQR